jgi:hypothetical protein
MNMEQTPTSIWKTGIATEMETIPTKQLHRKNSQWMIPQLKVRIPMKMEQHTMIIKN